MPASRTSLSILQSAVAHDPLASAALKALVERAEKAEGEAAKLREVAEKLPHHETCKTWRVETPCTYEAVMKACTCGKYAALSATAGRELLERMKAMREGLVQVQSMAADLLEDQDAILKPLRAIYDVATSALGVPSAVEHEAKDD